MSSILEVLERLVIQLELPLERAIGRAAPLAQRGDGLSRTATKVHIIAPPASTRHTRSYVCGSRFWGCAKTAITASGVSTWVNQAT